MRHLTDNERRELLGAYALDALEPDEREQIDELLLHDADARAELHALQLGASWLSESALRPPEHVWDGIAASIQPDAAPAGSRPDAEPIADVTPIKRSRSRVILAIAASLALVLAVGAGLLVLDRTDPQQPSSVNEAAAAARKAQGTRTARLAAPDGTVGATAVVQRDGRAYLVGTELPPLRAGRTYQLWAVRGTRPDSVALLGRHAQPRVFSAPKGTTAFAVSVEPTGGSKAPTTVPVIQGEIE